MSCFLVPATEAIVSSMVTKAVQAKEEKENNTAESGKMVICEETKTPFSRKLKWLNSMLWGGSALLAFEHVWHGELVPWFPFLTAAGNPNDAIEMLHEMSTVGVTMAALVTAVWAGMVAATNVIEKRPQQMTQTDRGDAQ